MESNRDNQLNDIVFANITRENSETTLETKKDKPTSRIWLIRESSIPKLLTVSYYSSQEKYKHVRIGLVNEKWQIMPANEEEARKTANMKSTTALFSTVEKINVDELFAFLKEKLKLDPAILIKPSESQASQNIKLYNYTQETLEEKKEAEKTTKYQDF